MPEYDKTGHKATDWKRFTRSWIRKNSAAWAVMLAI